MHWNILTLSSGSKSSQYARVISGFREKARGSGIPARLSRPLLPPYAN